MSSINLTEVDFCVIKEDYSRYLLDDGTLIKVKIVVRKIFTSPVITPEGYPTDTVFAADNAVTALVPANLKRPTSTEPYNPATDKGSEINFTEQKINTQEYQTDNGLRVTIRPVLTKVFRYDKYNQFGEPVYNTRIQQITHVDKTGSTTN